MKNSNRVRKNYTLRPVTVKALERLSKDMGVSMSRVIEAAVDKMRESQMNARLGTIPTGAPVPTNMEIQAEKLK